VILNRESALAYPRKAIALSEQSRMQSIRPCAAIAVDASGDALAEAMNDIHADCTGHAELVAVRKASSKFNPPQLRDANLYSSAEPCAMCAGAIYWSGIGRVVYALSEERLLQLPGNHPGIPRCRCRAARCLRAASARSKSSGRCWKKKP
jgi:tRNA(Arg) A34 adenosine deaminase TadA